MINNVIEDFHDKRKAGKHMEAIKLLELLVTRNSFSDKDLVTAIVTEDFLEDDCWIYLKKYRDKSAM